MGNKRAIWWAGGLLATAGLGRMLLRVPPLQPAPTPDPAGDHASALDRVARLQQRDHAMVNPLCRTRLLDHGQSTPVAVLLLHGFTNCPHQYHAFAEQLHAAGYNVLVPRYPRHGLDRLSDAPALLHAEELLDVTTQGLDAVCGLGRQVAVFGFSLGGVLASWLAQHRPEIDRAVVVSPALRVNVIPDWVTVPASNVLQRWPNYFQWWDPALKADGPGPQHAYPRFPSRGFAQVLRLGSLVLREAGHRAPAARSVRLVINPNDKDVDSRAVRRLAQRWARLHPDVAVQTIPVDLKLAHDIMDPGQPYQRIDQVYPLLTRLVTPPVAGATTSPA